MSTLLKPTPQRFAELASEGNLVPVYAELAADYETPLSAFQKIDDGSCSFLFESAEIHQKAGRYSLLGSSPRAIFTARGREVTIEEGGETSTFTSEVDPLHDLQELMARYRPATGDEGLPPFIGGAVGYLGYDMVRFFEPSIGDPPPDQLGLPDMVFFVADSAVVFDHKFRKITVVANVDASEFPSPEEAHAAGAARVGELIAKLETPLPHKALQAFSSHRGEDADNGDNGGAAGAGARSNTTREEYEGFVAKAKEYISAGDIFQVVPSQRLEADFGGDATDLYRALRHVNPSPYMFCMRFPGGLSLVGSSPEVHVRCLQGEVEIRPIAGTRWRGGSAEEDEALAAELLADPKERAEHLMLVDLARNDVGRAAEFGSVEVTDLMIVERYSHVMHIVSNVRGKLAGGQSAYDVMRATFPAGTVSGSPKVRAMEIIYELEKSKRGAYAGAVGYFGFDGDLDSCIALRTCVLKDGKAYVQAGAGVVADSDPAYEYEETLNKAKGMLRAIARARELGSG